MKWSVVKFVRPSTYQGCPPSIILLVWVSSLVQQLLDSLYISLQENKHEVRIGALQTQQLT